MNETQNFQLVLQTMSGPVLVPADPTKQNDMAQWVLDHMDKGGLLVFHNPDGVVTSCVRGQAILGFSFENIAVDNELHDLHKRRLKAEVEHIERSLKERRDEDKWKGGY